jgi:uncharacterized protein YyaL (SSP411 family)
MRAAGHLAFVVLGLALAGRALGSGPRSDPGPGAIAWEDWTEGAFERARREERFVLLDLGAVWCHWCHVMEETTYRDPRVVALVDARYVAVRVDQDARPDLSNRYEDYGWPATIIFDADGRELVKFSGYIPPLRMASLLQGVIDDPTPGPSVRAEQPPATPAEAALTPELRGRLLETLVSRYDPEHGGWGFVKKFLDWDAVEYSMVVGGDGDGAAERRARETLDAERRLIDPVWGGVYQYSHGGDWESPHYEKIMAFQAENLRIYSMAYARWREPAYLQAARDIHRYLRAFLASPEGAFYVSQDADVVRGEHAGAYFSLSDAERRRRGLPRVDTHLYARETAWATQALVALHAATGEAEPLQEALRAARWVLGNRALPGGGFRHDAADAAGPYLGDTIAAARAFLALYPATADRAWLARAEEAAAFIERRFRLEGGAGFASAVPRTRFEPLRPQRDENIAVARFANLLHHYTGKPEHRRIAEHALRYLAAPEVATRFETGGVLLADRELRSDPLHLTVVGHRDDPAARALLAAALAEPTAYKRVELWDKREGALPRADVAYPDLGTAAAFLCTEGRCSAPAYTPDQLRARRERVARPGVVSR